MSEKNLDVFIDLGTSNIRLGIFNQETSNNLFVLKKSCISNFSLKNFDINNSNEIIKDLTRLAEKKIDKHIKNINLMVDTPDMFSIDISIKKNTDSEKFTHNDIQALLQEAKNIIQNNYLDKKIVHMIVKKFFFDDKVYFQIPENETNCKSLTLELKFICFSNKIWQSLLNLFNSNFINIDNVYCSSYVRAVNCNGVFDNYKKKVILDIGYGRSAISIFDENRILYYNMLPVGGKHITKDISLLLNTNIEEAENIKKKLNKSDITFLEKSEKNIEIEPTELTNQVVFARIDEIIKLNLADQYCKSLFDETNDCSLIFTGEGSKILNKNSIYLEEKFDFFKEISFFEENTLQICESGFKFKNLKNFQEVTFLIKKPKNVGLFEKIFHFFK
tara:strand:+ start:1174 stop:2340 length:1167 start_codon:yes stop_codon:yes gene_type:complete